MERQVARIVVAVNDQTKEFLELVTGIEIDPGTNYVAFFDDEEYVCLEVLNRPRREAWDYVPQMPNMFVAAYYKNVEVKLDG